MKPVSPWIYLPAAALVAAACVAVPARAAWPNNPTVNVPVCTSPGGQNVGPCVSDGAGGAIVLWADGNVNGTDSLYLQRISTGGSLLWGSAGVQVCPGGEVSQSRVNLLADGEGGVFVVWMGVTNYVYDLRAQHVTAQGTRLWPAAGVTVLSPTSAQVEGPSITTDGRGGLLVTWFDVRSGSWDVYAQRVSSAGQAQWASGGVVVGAAADDQWWPCIAPDGAGGCIVCWLDYRKGNKYDVYAQRVSAAGIVQWAANGAPVCTATGSAWELRVISDETGGAVCAWMDNRSGHDNIYAQRISASGAAVWAADGVALSTASRLEQMPVMLPDGTGGAIVAFAAQYTSATPDIYAQRISGGGYVQWLTDGVPVYTSAGWDYSPAIASDGRGGAIVSWYGNGAGDNNVYAQRLSAAGALLWPPNGLAVGIANGEQMYPQSVADGAGGAIFVWQDSRNGSSYYDTDIYAQHVDPWGNLGVQPTITSVQDWPNDDGGHVSLTFSKSPLDLAGGMNVTEYWLWREVPPTAALAMLERGAKLAENGTLPPIGPGTLLRSMATASGTSYWEYMGAQVAGGYATYGVSIATACDSVGGSNPLTAFMVEARNATGSRFWYSDPATGYSVDNVGPPAPSPFTGQYAGGTVRLHWSPSTAADFAFYRIYRGSDPSFTPSLGNFVVAKADTGYTYAPLQPYYYRLAAVDVHGNEGASTLLLPAGTLDVPGGAPRELALSMPAPNPLRGASALRLSLPEAARVSLAVFDSQGRRVRTLADGVMSAGEHPFAWDGRDERGSAAGNALYFVRLETGGRTLVRRLAVVR